MADLHVSFVCTGNICRSPMAALMFTQHLADAGLAQRVRVSSAGTGGWHAGDPADHRTVSVLRAGGYPVAHRAAQFGVEHQDADLILALDSGHYRDLRALGVPVERLRLLRDFDPDADGPDVPDPYYGDLSDFQLVHDQIAAAIPGLLDWVDEALGDQRRVPAS